MDTIEVYSLDIFNHNTDECILFSESVMSGVSDVRYMEVACEEENWVMWI